MRVQAFSNHLQCSAHRCMRPAHPLSPQALLTHFEVYSSHPHHHALSVHVWRIWVALGFIW